jgi:hypothetical protein
MRRSALTGLALLLLAGAAGAANLQTFADPTGDNQPGAPDITTVQVSNDDNGRFELRVTLANRPDLLDHDLVNVYLDRDANTTTGCGPGVGVDYSLGALGHAEPEPDFFVLLRCAGSQMDARTPQASFTGSYDPTTQTTIFNVGCAEIGRPRSFRLVAVTETEGTTPTFDFAGLEQWIYTVVPPCPPDTQAPSVRALPSTGVRGGKAKLRFQVSDDGGETKEELAVFSGKRRLAHTTTSWGSAEARHVYFVRWPVPAHVQRLLRFCLRSKDRAGNRSKQSCARLVIR